MLLLLLLLLALPLQLNAMRAQPLFVTLALDTLLHRPESSDHDPHVCVGYLNDLIAMDGVDYITSTAMQKLLDDLGFRYFSLDSHRSVQGPAASR